MWNHLIMNLCFDLFNKDTAKVINYCDIQDLQMEKQFLLNIISFFTA
jgi:hypothetical protein